jgi:hypothetical protein
MEFSFRLPLFIRPERTKILSTRILLHPIQSMITQFLGSVAVVRGRGRKFIFQYSPELLFPLSHPVRQRRYGKLYTASSHETRLPSSMVVFQRRRRRRRRQRWQKGHRGRKKFPQKNLSVALLAVLFLSFTLVISSLLKRQGGSEKDCLKRRKKPKEEI